MLTKSPSLRIALSVLAGLLTGLLLSACGGDSAGSHVGTGAVTTIDPGITAPQPIDPVTVQRSSMKEPEPPVQPAEPEDSWTPGFLKRVKAGDRLPQRN